MASYERTLRSSEPVTPSRVGTRHYSDHVGDGQNDLMILAVGYAISIALQKLYVLSPSS